MPKAIVRLENLEILHEGRQFSFHHGRFFNYSK